MKFLPWLPTILTVAALVIAVVVVTIRLLPGHFDPVTLPPPEPAFTVPTAPASVFPLPVPTADTSGTAGSNPPARATPPASPKPPAGSAPTRSRPATAAPASGPVTGHYQVLNSYADSFIGQVLVTNGAATAKDWVVVLSFPSGVGDLRTSWLESLPQPTLSTSGRTFTWRSTVPLAAGSAGPLRFQFERPGSAETPSRCTVNGAACR